MKIYLACPYSDGSLVIRNYRFSMANEAAAWLMSGNNIVFSPISHSVPIAKTGQVPELSWQFWRKQDFAFLEWADALVVLKINGWEKSVGVREEIEEARRLDKPIVYTTMHDIQNGAFNHEN